MCVAVTHELARRLHEEYEGDPLEDALREFIRDTKANGDLLIKDGQGRFVDAWGTPLVIKVSEVERKAEIRVRSCGPDRELTTADDVSYHRSVNLRNQQNGEER